MQGSGEEETMYDEPDNQRATSLGKFELAKCLAYAETT